MTSRTVLGFGALALALGTTLAGVAVARSTPGSVEIRVPGARTIAVYCGGDTTAHGDGETVVVTPKTPHCFIEAPLTPLMPLRGQLTLGSRRTVVCRRDNMTIRCD